MTGDTNTPLTPDSAAVMKYLDMYQAIISRMAGNSSDCKKWAVALVSAIFLLVADKGKVGFIVVAWIPVILFWFLDAYYLALEQQFRKSSNQVVTDLHAGQLYSHHLFKFYATGRLPKTMLGSFVSWAVWPFYLGLLGLVTLAGWSILHVASV